ncbi:transcriptional regulator [Dinoroseobacter shibae DFL 12 = DSM 16493]|jgi:DNA-binding GntR family transcriptional regulator|uniref:Transcriptional regulator n=5 Tax=Pseudomonadota TaxID=1224 RepID=A8LNG2_DINSH|nr:transcriptional regulator [Dinoroseobacter shibae DFL 12 = DSM 16493]
MPVEREPEMNLAKPIARPSLHAELVDRVRELIIEGSLEPGTKIPEKELCQSFGVSRTPMREALKVLANEGLAVLEPNRGAWVSTVTMEELEETFPVIAALERLAGELACAHGSDAQIAHIRTRHDDMMACFATRNRQAYFKANQDIHDGILEAAGNEVLSQHHRVLGSRVKRARFLANISDARWAQAVAEHEGIITALEARDGPLLGQLLSAHLGNKFAALKARMN